MVCSIGLISRGRVWGGFRFLLILTQESSPIIKVCRSTSVQLASARSSAHFLRRDASSSRLPPSAAAAEIKQTPSNGHLEALKAGYGDVLCIFNQHFPKQMLAEG